MSVVANPQQLEVDPSHRGDQLVVTPAFGVKILRHTVGHMGFLLIDIHMVKKVGIHKITVALGILPGNAAYSSRLTLVTLEKSISPLRYHSTSCW